MKRPKPPLLAGILALLLASSLGAQPSFVCAGYVPPAEFPLARGDYDGDGQQDLLIADARRTALYRNALKGAP